MRRQLSGPGSADSTLKATPRKLPSLNTSWNKKDSNRRNGHPVGFNAASSNSPTSWNIMSPGVPRAKTPASLRQTLRMAWYHVRRPSRAWRSRLRIFGLVLLALLIIDAWRIAMYRPKGTRVSPASVDGQKPRVFIASIHRNTEKILRGGWTRAVVDLVEYLGPDNVYVSIYESGSVVDDTKVALGELDMMLEHLKVARNITLDPLDQLEEVARIVEQKEDNWIWTPRDKYELRRIPYLANIRNGVMAELYEQEKQGHKYDYVLWINDVVFNTEDVTTLLSTNGGIFDAACGMDYKMPHQYYDTFALRDFQGSKALPISWPYFTYNPSRERLIALDPVPVKSCWNGIVALKSAPFYANPPLKFRGVPDSLAMYHLEGSECCLIHADNNGEHARHGVYINPNVRVAYSPEIYKAVNPENGSWPGAQEKLLGMWRNRLQRLLAWPKRRFELNRVRTRVRSWQEVQGEEESRVHGEAEHCLINEMQVLESAGWRHL